MEELVTIDDYDLEKQNARWDPTEWIGCQRTFCDVPDFVAVEAVRVLRVPPEIQACLPAKSLSPSELYTSWALPACDPCFRGVFFHGSKIQKVWEGAERLSSGSYNNKHGET